MKGFSFIQPHNREISMGSNVEVARKRLITRSTVVNILFCFGLYLTLVQQLPIVRDLAYEEIRWVLYGVFGSLSVYCFIRFPYGRMPRLIKYFLLSMLVNTTFFILLNTMNSGAQLMVSYNDTIELLIPLGILVVSKSLKYNRKQLSIVVLYYCISTAILGVLLVYYYGGSWIIISRYFLEAKNQIGSMMAISFMCALAFFSKWKEHSSIYKIIAMSSCMVLFMVLLVIRSRSALLAILIVLSVFGFFLLFSKKSICNYIMAVATILVLILIGVSGKGQYIIKPIYNAFTLNYEVSDIESISAGRMGVYKGALDYIASNLFWGGSFTNNKFEGIPHAYLLNKMVRYGIIGSLPLVLFYFYLWLFLLSRIFSYSNLSSNIANFAPLVMMIPMIISFFEYSAPYGPGVSQVMAWFLLGQYLREEQAALVKKL